VAIPAKSVWIGVILISNSSQLSRLTEIIIKAASVCSNCSVEGLIVRILN
jgi:hypothetical protein